LAICGVCHHDCDLRQRSLRRVPLGGRRFPPGYQSRERLSILIIAFIARFRYRFAADCAVMHHRLSRCTSVQIHSEDSLGKSRPG
jgi:hypothetical protein